MAGRPPQPLAVAKLKGATRHDPQRYRGVPEGSPEGVGGPPDYLRSEVKAMWFEILTWIPAGVATASERPVVELLANLMVEYRRDPDGFQIGKYPAIRGAMNDLGLSPAARRKIVVPAKPKENSFAEFVTKQ